MAQKVSVRLLDDLILMNTDGKEEVEADGTVQIGLDGTWYRIDLRKNNEVELREMLDPYIQAASQKLPRGSSKRSRTVASRQRSAEIRDWARARGHQVSERGRIPEAVVAEYDAAH